MIFLTQNPVSLQTGSHIFLKIILRYIYSFIENILSEVDSKMTENHFELVSQARNIEHVYQIISNYLKLLKRRIAGLK